MKEVQRWTGLVSANSGGGFVAYGDYLEQAAEIERLQREVVNRNQRRHIGKPFQHQGMEVPDELA